jgi:putative membrane protein
MREIPVIHLLKENDMKNQQRVASVLLGLFIFTMVYGLFAPRVGLPEIPGLMHLSTMAGFGFALVHAGTREGWKRAALFLGLTFVISLLFESVGVMTGWVYGHYHYSENLGYRIFGLVPLLIPIAWFMMMYPSFVIADTLAPSSWKGAKRLFAVAAAGGLVMTAWDIVMDPLMSRAGNWIWENGGAYYHIPLQNFWGWWLTTFTVFALYLWISKRSAPRTSVAFDRLAFIAYATTGYANLFVALTTGLGGAGLAGFFAMTPWLMTACFRTRDV